MMRTFVRRLLRRKADHEPVKIYDFRRPRSIFDTVFKQTCRDHMRGSSSDREDGYSEIVVIRGGGR